MYTIHRTVSHDSYALLMFVYVCQIHHVNPDIDGTPTAGVALILLVYKYLQTLPRWRGISLPSFHLNIYANKLNILHTFFGIKEYNTALSVLACPFLLYSTLTNRTDSRHQTTQAALCVEFSSSSPSHGFFRGLGTHSSLGDRLYLCQSGSNELHLRRPRSRERSLGVHDQLSINFLGHSCTVTVDCLAHQKLNAFTSALGCFWNPRPPVAGGPSLFSAKALPGPALGVRAVVVCDHARFCTDKPP